MIDLSQKERNQIEEYLYHFRTKYPKYEIVFLTVSGSHIYGTKDESVDTDIDLRGAYSVPTRDILSGNDYPKTIEDLNTIPMVDSSMQEIGKFMDHLLTPNMNFIEMVKSPLTIISPPKELVEIADSMISKDLFPHIQGFSIHTWKHAEREKWMKPKRILYLYRDLLRGLLLFQGKPFMSDIFDMTRVYGNQEVIDKVDLLFESKKAGGSLMESLGRENIPVLQGLQAEMLRLKTFGTLNEKPLLDKSKVRRFLINLRVVNLLSEMKKMYEYKYDKDAAKESVADYWMLPHDRGDFDGSLGDLQLIRKFSKEEKKNE